MFFKSAMLKIVIIGKDTIYQNVIRHNGGQRKGRGGIIQQRNWRRLHFCCKFPATMPRLSVAGWVSWLLLSLAAGQLIMRRTGGRGHVILQLHCTTIHTPTSAEVVHPKEYSANHDLQEPSLAKSSSTIISCFISQKK